MENQEPDFPATTAEAEALRHALDDLETRSRSFGTALSGALKSAASGGKGLEDVLRGLGNRLTDIALSAGLKPLENVLDSAVSGLFGGAAKLTPFADGGVVSRPTFFPMGGDMGLMGEAGSEAILPLKRGADGALGVAAATGGPTQIVFNVTATDAQSFQKSEAQIAAMLTRTAMRGQRNI
jgi:phage-related minor tail protein